ncbi:MAG: hypothetical protein H8D97_01715 [Proteobacteria bacterium]|nr:hypothetical protein [Pseudomonadota bacterium]
MANSAQHSSKEQTDPNLSSEEGQAGILANNIFSNEALKPLEREFIQKMLSSFFQMIPNQKLGKQSSVFSQAGVNNAVISCNNNMDAEETLTRINLELIVFMNDFIESEKGESCKKFYRTQNLYESKIDGNRLILTWF